MNQFSGQLASIVTLKEPDSLRFLTLITKFQSLSPFGRGTQGLFPPKYIENTFSATQGTLRSLEMHFKWCYKICICTVILKGNLSIFEITR